VEADFEKEIGETPTPRGILYGFRTYDRVVPALDRTNTRRRRVQRRPCVWQPAWPVRTRPMRACSRPRMAF